MLLAMAGDAMPGDTCVLRRLKMFYFRFVQLGGFNVLLTFLIA